MIKATLYIGLTLVGIVAALISPFAGVIACLEAYLMNPTAFVEGEFRYQFWVTVALLIGFLVHRPKGLPRSGREGLILIFLWLFVAIGAFSAVWAEFSATAATDAIFEVVKTVVLVTILVRCIRTDRQLRTLMIACFLGVWHAAFFHTFGVKWGYVAPSLARESVLPDGQQPVMYMFMPLLVLGAVLGKGIERPLCWFAIPFVLNSIVGTYERTGLIALVVQMVMLLVFLPRRTVMRLLPAIAVAGAVFLFRLTPEDYWARMKTIKTPTEEASANSRLVVNRASLRMLQDFPLLGVGYRNYPYVSPRYLSTDYLTDSRRSAHNSFFTIACELGLVGFVVWISAFLTVLYLLRRIRKRSDPAALTSVEVYAMGVETGLYGWLVGGWFQAHHEVDPAYWFAGIAIVLTRLASISAEPQPEGDTATASPGVAASSHAVFT